MHFHLKWYYVSLFSVAALYILLLLLLLTRTYFSFLCCQPVSVPDNYRMFDELTSYISGSSFSWKINTVSLQCFFLKHTFILLLRSHINIPFKVPKDTF